MGKIIMDASSRPASRIIAILEWEEASEQTETAQTACAENAVVLKAGETVLKVAPDGVTITGNLAVSGSISGG